MDIAIIVPTRNRPIELKALLSMLASQSVSPTAIVVIDSSDNDGHKAQIHQIVAASRLPIKLLDHWPPSAGAQRNRGLDEVGASHSWVMLLDDDIQLGSDALARLSRQFDIKGRDYIGFNLNASEPGAFRAYGFLRSLKLVEAMGLYASRIGRVTQSGWHTRMSNVKRDIDVEWLSTGAMVLKTAAIGKLRFDEFFVSYSYLEDLDFSFRASKLGRLCILADVAYIHTSASTAKRSWKWFGRIEVRNRLYFVKKHKLSIARFWLAMSIRMLISLAGAIVGRRDQFHRLQGNIAEIFDPSRVS